jgi:hypothetical protein
MTKPRNGPGKTENDVSAEHCRFITENVAALTSSVVLATLGEDCFAAK